MAQSENEKKDGELGNDDLKVTKAGDVARDSEVDAKTTPNLRKETGTDNRKTFETDFTIYLPGTDELTDELRDRQHTAVRTAAVQRGLIPTGPVKLIKEDKLADGANVRLVYAVTVQLNTLAADGQPGVAVAPQPDDTPADIPERRKGGKRYTERTGDRRTETLEA